MTYFNKYLVYYNLLSTTDLGATQSQVKQFIQSIILVPSQWNDYKNNVGLCIGLDYSTSAMFKLIKSLNEINKDAEKILSLAAQKCVELKDLLELLKKENKIYDDIIAEINKLQVQFENTPLTITEEEIIKGANGKLISKSVPTENKLYYSLQSSIATKREELKAQEIKCTELCLQIDLIINIFKQLNVGNYSGALSLTTTIFDNGNMIEIPYNIIGLFDSKLDDKTKRSHSQYKLDNPVKFFIDIDELERLLKNNRYGDEIISKLTNGSANGDKMWKITNNKVYSLDDDLIDYQEEVKEALIISLNQMLKDTYSANNASTQYDYQLISSTILANNPFVQFRYGDASIDVAWTNGVDTFLQNAGQYTCHKFVGWTASQGYYNMYKVDDAENAINILKNVNEFTTTAVMSKIGYEEITSNNINELVPGAIVIREAHTGTYAGTMTNENGDKLYLVNEATGRIDYFAIMTKIYTEKKFLGYWEGVVTESMLNDYIRNQN